MKQKLQLYVFMLLVHVSVGAWQRLAVKYGQTVHLKCPITDAHLTNVEWKNPDGFIMFFSHNKGEETLKDKRHNIIKLSKSEFTISISSVTFRDGGIYTCSQYGQHLTEKKVEVTVIGHPKMNVAKHEGRTVVKCTAEGNNHPPQIYWKFNNGPEFQAQAQVLHEDKTYVSMDTMTIIPPNRRVTVKCLVRHPALHSQPLMNFVKIGRDAKSPYSTTTSSLTEHPSEPTGVMRTSSRSRTTDVTGATSDHPIRLSTSPATGSTVSTTGSPLSTSDDSGTSSLSTRRRNDSDSNATSTSSWISVAKTTEESTSQNQTERNRTVSSNNPKMQAGTTGSSWLLVFLVTFLILCLLVVVIFFAIKLRRAHIVWKRVFIVAENEDSDPSEDSSKSKTSQEERNTQGQRRRGLFNTAFTPYVIEEPTVITSVINTAAMTALECENKEHTSQSQTLGQTSDKCKIKETEL
ncbi:cytotoxic and regulatory T-cell molecule isoform X2 [Labrus bergylta]|uniref:cytotoxic and regulatory T-cell molecule isoform X2 n=1 Tax=Labrus bergylta TaxID=56723 RepID=UPI0009B3D579|nr:cytotoxic and regulatory T-cell molecule isoform X2 [Labrus bergylta]